MRFVLLLLLLFSFPLYAVIDTYKAAPPNKAFMNYFLEGYLDWYKKEFGFSLKTENKDDTELISLALKKIDHWFVPGNKKLDQLLIGRGYDHKDVPFYTFRIYIHPELLNHPALKKNSEISNPLFIEWSKKTGTCFIGETTHEEVKWKHIPLLKGAIYFKHVCQKQDFISLLTEEESSVFPHPFRGSIAHELRTFSEEGPEKIEYFSKSADTFLFPKKHFSYISRSGNKTLLPLDKFSIDKNGDYIIYYP